MRIADLDDRSVLLVGGPGGVGKTTVSASLGLAAARRGRRVLVVTVDPARRLAEALGLDELDDEPHLVRSADGGGELWASMLDARATFDRLVVEEAPTPERARRILDNRVYQGISGSLAGAQEYMAVERLHQVRRDERFDLVIVDTPPSRQALDLVGAADRLSSFLGHPVYRALTSPGRNLTRLTAPASQAFEWTVRRLAGPTIVEDTLAFFRELAGMEEGVRRRAGEIDAELRAPTTAFILVSSPRTEALDETRQLAAALVDTDVRLAGAVVNLVHPDPGPLVSAWPGAEGPLAEHLEIHALLSSLAEAEQHLIDDLSAGIGLSVVTVPMLSDDVHDVDGLALVAEHL